MSQLGSVMMRVVYQEMLEEEDRVEGGHQFNRHQVLVAAQVLGFGTRRGVPPEPLQQRRIFVSDFPFKIQL